MDNLLGVLGKRFRPYQTQLNFHCVHGGNACREDAFPVYKVKDLFGDFSLVLYGWRQVHPVGVVAVGAGEQVVLEIAAVNPGIQFCRPGTDGEQQGEQQQGK